ncbi:MAG: ATP-grasp domain-containing protein, partial [Gammaproteobacteria bacterium]|nr:ATP-grasp domain-containing protein [Gammaproteobacteria bacterium]NIR85085.1 ATP-grasp domain-containing protein [Gammaproteobacteria bacterium]NIU03689.1 ATP-grasp domain-containing protein [Gammaproteobacteria bacterium]NIV51024.1 ATP-grasp domain-containing protein [Gammaproteobacteria bacterium]NIV73545.1 ATP-grasp domain-containing protein [Gammaproteobacteria bacterium]
ACHRIRVILERHAIHAEERDRLLVEDFVPGAEVALEGMLADGRLETIALFDKPDPLEGPYFEETYYVTPSRLDREVQAWIGQRVAEACAAYGLRTGPVHAELRVTDSDAYVLEVAARTIGGECARLLELATGRPLEELVLARAVGQALPVQPVGKGAGVLMLPVPRHGVLRRVEGVIAARKVPHVQDVVITVREGYELVPLPEGGSYPGFVYALAPTPQEAEKALREAHAKLTIVTAPLFQLQAGSERA